MKLLDISNNDLNQLPPELGIMPNLTKIQIEGNPLRSIRMAIRTGGTNRLKKYLSSKIDPNAPPKEFGKKGSKFSKIKQEMVQNEFNGPQSGKKSQWTMLIREFKDTSGHFDLRGKKLSEIDEGILDAGTVSRLDLSNNEILELPPFLYKLDPSVLKINQNFLKEIGPSFINFRNLREIELKKNNISSFLGNLTSAEETALHDNFIAVTSIDLGQNLLTHPPKCLKFFQNLRLVNLSYNKMDTIETLFEQEGVLETMESLDVSNNQLTSVPSQIYKWQRIHTLSLENNNIR